MSIERRRMNYSEYEDLKAYASAIGELTAGCENMETRIKEIPNGWRDAKMIAAVSKKILENLMMTLPADKLKQLRSEIPKLKLKTVYTGPLPSRDDDNKTLTVKQDDIWTLVDMVRTHECEFCMKDGKKVQRCKVRKLIERMLSYHMDTVDAEGNCAFNTYSIENPFTVIAEEKAHE